jgi:hypothetical protein
MSNVPPAGGSKVKCGQKKKFLVFSLKFLH